MGVHDPVNIGPRAIDLLMEGQLGRRAMRSHHGAVRVHAHDVLAAQAAFVEPRGRDPDIAVLFADGKIAARRGGHAVAVDALNRL